MEHDDVSVPAVTEPVNTPAPKRKYTKRKPKDPNAPPTEPKKKYYKKKKADSLSHPPINEPQQPELVQEKKEDEKEEWDVVNNKWKIVELKRVLESAIVDEPKTTLIRSDIPAFDVSAASGLIYPVMHADMITSNIPNLPKPPLTISIQIAAVLEEFVRIIFRHLYTNTEWRVNSDGTDVFDSLLVSDAIYDVVRRCVPPHTAPAAFDIKTMYHTMARSVALLDKHSVMAAETLPVHYEEQNKRLKSALETIGEDTVTAKTNTYTYLCTSVYQ